MKGIRIASVSFLVLTFVISPVSFSGIALVSRGVSVEEITGYEEWNQSRTVDKNVVVKPGATLVIGKGVEINFTQPWIGIQVKQSPHQGNCQRADDAEE